MKRISCIQILPDGEQKPRRIVVFRSGFVGKFIIVEESGDDESHLTVERVDYMGEHVDALMFPPSDVSGFLDEAAQVRGSFVKQINSMEWDTDLRTRCEDILIMYDQMTEMLRSG